MDFELFGVVGVSSVFAVGFWAFFHYRGKWSIQAREDLIESLLLLDVELAELAEDSELPSGALLSEGLQQSRFEFYTDDRGTLFYTANFPNGSTIELRNREAQFEFVLSFLSGDLHVAYSRHLNGFEVTEELEQVALSVHEKVVNLRNRYKKERVVETESVTTAC